MLDYNKQTKAAFTAGIHRFANFIRIINFALASVFSARIKESCTGRMYADTSKVFLALLFLIVNIGFLLLLSDKTTQWSSFMLNKLRCQAHFLFSANQMTWPRLLIQMTNSEEPDQLASSELASSEANWSGCTLFAKEEYVQVQHDKG